MVLWGKFACDVCEAMQVRDEHSIVLVLRFGKIKVWKEDRSVSNAYKITEIGLNPPMIEVGKFIAILPRDELPLAIVESKNSAIVNGVSAKDDFFILTPRKTIAQILETKQIEETNLLPPALNNIIGETFLFKIQIERENFVYKQETYNVLKVITNKDLISDFEESHSANESEDGQFHDMETQSDAPEVSLAIQGLVSKQSESFDLTPAKRIRAVNIDTKEILDDNSVTRSVSSVKIKKEKFAKSD
ncbi:uncharacterized protein LOC106453819 [Brassica napus]|uniref:uncharacterized protein LOC106453819 n=1 Tax=Brassica napus TaxID=3708 RepID=UPI000BBF1810|nr:uncharacterized protein LOC106453819 [Brassica napus]